MKVIGSFVSPYVRKVLACMELKGLAYEVDPITAFFGGEEFERLSPLRRIPVLIDADVVLADSTVICEYLEDAYPGRRLLPEGAKARALSRWIEEYADTRLGDAFIWGLFYPKFVQPMIWGEEGDQARIEKTLNEDLPREMDYLESRLPEAGFLFGEEIGLADISVATFFRNGAYVGYAPDPQCWPKTAAFAQRALDHPCFSATLPFEKAQLGTNPQGRRKALMDAGAPLTAETLGTHTPRRGVMRL